MFFFSNYRFEVDIGFRAKQFCFQILYNVSHANLYLQSISSLVLIFYLNSLS